MYLNTLKTAHPELHKSIAASIIADTEKHLLQTDNIIVAKCTDYYAAVNTELLRVIPFDTEEEAANYALDHYNNSLHKQTKLF